jgi:hypothetical protein
MPQPAVLMHRGLCILDTDGNMEGWRRYEKNRKDSKYHYLKNLYPEKLLHSGSLKIIVTRGVSGKIHSRLTEIVQVLFSRFLVFV